MKDEPKLHILCYLYSIAECLLKCGNYGHNTPKNEINKTSQVSVSDY